MDILQRIGAAVLNAIAALGRFIWFFLNTSRAIFGRPFYVIELLKSLMALGYFSLPVVGLTALFTGAALALQIYAGGARFNAEAVVPQIVAIGMVRELGPVLVGLMLAARVTSSVAAELATMKVTEQIDALVTLSTDPIKYLVLPRFMAGVLTAPLLVAVADAIGIFGGYLVGTGTLGFNASSYLINTANFLTAADIISSLVKGMVFGGLATLVGCYFGLNSGRGAQGVGQSTKGSVETAAVTILAANFILTALFFSS